MSWDKVTTAQLKDLMGYAQSDDVTDRQLLDEVQRSYHVFHIHINEASYKNDPSVLGYWKRILGERLIVLEDYNAIAETIASTVAVIHGIDLTHILDTFDASTAKTVKNALVNVSKNGVTPTAKRDSFLSKILKL
jgi:hypothetical protein